MSNNVMTKGSQPVNPGTIPQSGGNDNRLPNRETQPAGGPPAPATTPPATAYPSCSTKNRQPRWGHFLIGSAILIAGYGTDILYCNNWHLVDPNHIPSGYTGIIAIYSLCFAALATIIITFADDIFDGAVYAAPIATSLTAIVAGAAGLPIGSWMTKLNTLSIAQESLMFSSLYIVVIHIIYLTCKYNVWKPSWY